ncbi:MAG: NHL repeat-containing protein [Polyangiaceae bacterium]|nr:NHL repeat-containing protein [Polyangiaceae bacterium]
MSHIRSFVFFALFATGCTGFDLSDQFPSGTPNNRTEFQGDGGDDASDGNSNNGDDVRPDTGPKTYVVSTLAGTGAGGAVDGPSSQATFSDPVGIAIGPDNSLYVTDQVNNKIRKIAVDGTVSTYAGTGADGDLTDGPCETATFYYPWGIAVDTAGNVYVADRYHNAIRKITPTPCEVTTLVGGTWIDDDVRDMASLSNPMGLTVDGSGNVFVADSGNNKIRKVDPNGKVTTIAGTGTAGSTNGPTSSATFNHPAGIAVDTNGTLYVGGDSTHDIRKITTDGQVTLLAGSGAYGPVIDGTGTDAALANPYGIAFDADGNLLVADTNNYVVRKVTPDGKVTTIAGQREAYTNKGVMGDTDGPGDTAAFGSPVGIAVDSNGVIYVTDSFFGKIRKIELVQQ